MDKVILILTLTPLLIALWCVCILVVVTVYKLVKNTNNDC